MFIGAIKNVFPIVTIIASFIVIVVGILRDNKDAMIAGTTVAGIAGTAYNSSTNGEADEKLSTALQKKRRKPPGVGSGVEQ